MAFGFFKEKFKAKPEVKELSGEDELQQELKMVEGRIKSIEENRANFPPGLNEQRQDILDLDRLNKRKMEIETELKGTTQKEEKAA